MGEPAAPLQMLVGLAENSGAEPPVTLQVGGRIVTGFITPLDRWRDQVEGLAKAGEDDALQHVVANTSPGPISDWEKEEIQGRAAESGGKWEGFESFCLRDAKIRTETPAPTRDFPLLVVSCDAVEALALGHWMPRSEAGGDYPFQAEEDD